MFDLHFWICRYAGKRKDADFYHPTDNVKHKNVTLKLATKGIPRIADKETSAIFRQDDDGTLTKRTIKKDRGTHRRN